MNEEPKELKVCPKCGNSFLDVIHNRDINLVLIVHDYSLYKGNKVKFREAQGCSFTQEEIAKHLWPEDYQ